jgi:dTMP kinase
MTPSETLRAVRRDAPFVVIEGGEGAGKGSALASLESALRRAGYDPLVTREPGGGGGTAALRALIVESGGAEWTPLAELFLLMADRAQHVARVVRPMLEAGRAVLCDRFGGSTLAYQGAGKGLPTSLIENVHESASGGLAPDLTMLFDVDPEKGLARSTQRLSASASLEDRFEKLDAAFHARVRACFLEQARVRAGEWIVIDANQPLDSVIQDAVSRLEAWLDEWVAAGRA